VIRAEVDERLGEEIRGEPRAQPGHGTAATGVKVRFPPPSLHGPRCIIDPRVSTIAFPSYDWKSCGRSSRGISGSCRAASRSVAAAREVRAGETLLDAGCGAGTNLALAGDGVRRVGVILHIEELRVWSAGNAFNLLPLLRTPMLQGDAMSLPAIVERRCRSRAGRPRARRR
jgi:hypothetical protein